MDAALRRAWTGIVTPDDYEHHMAAIGQAQAAAELTRRVVLRAGLPPGGALTIAGAGTGQMFEFLEDGLFDPYRLTCTDLNASFLDRLRERLVKRGLTAAILQDDFENTSLSPGIGLLLATLLLEHIDWRKGVATIAGLQPAMAAVILQENPPGLTSAITPGRTLPPSIAKASETAHPVLLPRGEFIDAMAAQQYALREVEMRDVDDGKRLVALLFDRC